MGHRRISRDAPEGSAANRPLHRTPSVERPRETPTEEPTITDTTKHTPTPWRLTKINGKRDCLVNATGGRITYVDDDSLRQMEHAVRCVNERAALVARVAELERALKLIAALRLIASCEPHHRDDVVSIARAALAKVQS
jgi:hypothetical protein